MQSKYQYFKVRHYGRHFGYPLCCIESFITLNAKGVIIPHWERSAEQQAVKKYGFIPCQAHALEILQGRVQIEDLILKTRSAKRPFVPRKG